VTLLAIKVDRGEITRAEADVQLAQVLAEVRNKKLVTAPHLVPWGGCAYGCACCGRCC
jgi:hypothetical protein